MSKYNIGRKPTHRPQRPITGPRMKINGVMVSLVLAPHSHVCGECYGKIERHNAGLRCTATPTHRGFVTRAIGREIQEAQNQNVNELSEVYKIVGGKVVIK